MYTTPKNLKIRIYAVVVTMGIVFFVPFLGAVHLFDWDEINFAEAAREMIETGDYLTVRIDYEPFHEKPPLFIWAQVASMKVFGVNEFAARFPSAIVGLISILFVFWIGERIFNYFFGIFWVLAYLGSFLPHFYFKTGIIDPTFNLFIFAGVYFLGEFFFRKEQPNEKKSRVNRNLVFAGLSIGLAVLTKGPVGYLLVFLTLLIFWFFNRKQIKFPVPGFILFTILAFAPLAIWYFAVFLASDSNVFVDFINYHWRLLTTEDAGHGGPIYYHFIVLLIGCFPASIFALRAFKRNEEDSGYQRNFKQWTIILLLVVLVVFSIVKTKIIHYSSLGYFPLTFLAAYSMYHVSFRQLEWKKWATWAFGVIGALWGLALTALPLVLMNIDLYMPFITDKFTKALLQADVQWGGFEHFIGLFYLVAVVSAIILFAKKEYIKAFSSALVSTAAAVFLLLPLLAPKIESYTQATPIEFYRSVSDSDVYITTLGYKSYAHYFYGERRKENSSYRFGMDKKEFKDYLLTGDIEKTAYFVAKNKKADKYLEEHNLKKMFAKNGYVFMRRDAGN